MEFEIDAILKPENNHSVFEYNRKTNTIRYADIIHPTVVNWHTWKQELNNREIIKNDNCLYVSALNVKNAIKHFNKAYNLNLTDKTINIQSDTTHAKRNLKFNITRCY
jgi:hypothetical protein